MVEIYQVKSQKEIHGLLPALQIHRTYQISRLSIRTSAAVAQHCIAIIVFMFSAKRRALKTLTLNTFIVFVRTRLVWLGIPCMSSSH